MSSAHRGECVSTGGLYRPTHLCVAHFELHKKKKVHSSNTNDAFVLELFISRTVENEAISISTGPD